MNKEWFVLGLIVVFMSSVDAADDQSKQVFPSPALQADGYAIDKAPSDGTGDAYSFNEAVFWVGKVERTRDDKPDITRGLVFFPLPEPPEGKELAQATVVFKQHRARKVDRHVAVYHSDIQNRITHKGANYFQDKTFDNKVGILKTQQSSDKKTEEFPTGEEKYSLDVTEAVQKDYSKDPFGMRVSAFRLQCAENGKGSPSGYYRFFSANHPQKEHHPRLILRFEEKKKKGEQ